MITEIDTKKLLKIYNPFKDGIYYLNQKIDISISEINKSIRELKKIEDLNYIGNDLKKEFYLNLVMYMYNNHDNKSIEINLNNEENPIISGTLELIKQLYNKEEKIILSINNNEDNNHIFITKEQLKPSEKRYESAKDQRFTKLTNELFNNIEVVSDDKFFWNINTETNLSILEKIELIPNFKKEDLTYDEIITLKEDIENTLKNFSDEEINNDEFKVSFLKTINHNLYEYLLDKDPNLSEFILKFSNKNILEVIKTELLQSYNLENSLYNYFFHTSNYEENKNSYFSEKETEEFMNSDIVIHLAEKTPHEEIFCSIYRKFNLENKKKFFEKLITHSRPTFGHTHYLTENIYLAPVELLDKKENLKNILPRIHIRDLKNHFKEKNYTSSNIYDLSLITDIDLNTESLFDIAIEFKYNQKQLQEIINLDENVLIKLMNYHDVPKNINIIELLVNLIKNNHSITNVNVKYIPTEYLKSILLITDESIPELNHYLNRFFLNSNLNYNLLNKKEYEYIINKFHTIENSFIKTTYGWSDILTDTHGKKTKAKDLKNLETEEEVLKLLDSIQYNISNSLNSDLQINSSSFYKNLNNKLKDNSNIAERLINLSKLPYEEMSPSLRFNFEFNLKLIRANKKYLEHIPVEFYNNTQFSLGIAKLLDDKLLKKDELPSFVQIFFNKTDHSYHDFLNSHILYHTLKKETKSNVKTVSKPVKI